MAVIDEAGFTTSWTTAYPSALATGEGALVTRPGHRAVVEALGPDLGMPWQTVGEPQGWSRFWSSYLGRPGALRRPLSSDAAWEHVVPFQFLHASELVGPPGAAARSRVLLYPAAVSVIVTVRVRGSWQVGELAGALHDLRTAAAWGEPGATTRNRTLRGIATQLRDRVAAVPFGGAAPGEPEVEVVRTAATPLSGQGEPAEFALTDGTVRSCVAGLASLGPPGEFVEAKLLAANSDANLGGRHYVLSGGHAVWHPEHLRRPPQGDPLSCLLHNQTDLAAHIEALGSTVAWAAERIEAGDQVPVAVQPLVRVSAERLRVLHRGNSRSTYRSGLAMVRIEPLLSAVEAVWATF